MVSKKRKIEPELLETPWQKEATTWLGEALKQPYKPYPVGEVDVGRIMESPYYQGLKTQALTEEQRGLEQLRRGAQLGGMLYSTPRLGAEAQMIGGTTSRLQQLLGGMAEQERQQNIAREYQEHLRGQQYPLQMSQLAQLLLGYAPWQYPMYEEQPSPFSQIMQYIGQYGPSMLGSILGIGGAGTLPYGSTSATYGVA